MQIRDVLKRNMSVVLATVLCLGAASIYSIKAYAFACSGGDCVYAGQCYSNGACLGGQACTNGLWGPGKGICPNQP
jgi:hypothetical protein